MSTAALRVLVVDDNADITDTTVALLTAGGHDAHPAYSCADALKAVADFRPEVVVLDLQMTDGTGYALVSRLERSLGYRPAFVAVTGVSGLEGHSRGVGLDRHLVKPVDPGVLLETIRQAVAGEPSRPEQP